jgi:acetolactate synthase I/II/III large subunit
MEQIERPVRRRTRDIRRRSADMVLERLVDAGVDTIFGLPGGSIAPLYDALYDWPGLRVVTMRNDGNAVFAAAGYAHTTGRLGVAFVTSGPGVFNCVNAVASSFADSLPLLLIAGEAPRSGFGRGAIQEGSSYGPNVVEMLSRITKVSVQANEGSSVPGLLDACMQEAMSGRRGPAFLSIPLDVQGQTVTGQRGVYRTSTVSSLDPRAVSDVAKALNGDGKKLIVVGAGARGAGVAEKLLRLAETLDVPVVTTPKGKGAFPEDHRLSLGIFGMGGHDSAREYVRGGCDTVLVLGSSLNEVGTDGWHKNLGASRCFVHVDIDPQRIGRAYPTDVAINAPVDLFLDALFPRLISVSSQSVFGVSHNVAAGQEETPRDGRLSPVVALRELQKVLPTRTIFTTDSGNNLFFSIHYLLSRTPDTFMSMLGMGSMGVAIPTAFGAKIANPGRPVCAITGDGGFLMAMAEISVSAANDAPIVVFVLNDQRMAMVEHGHRNVYKRTLSYSTEPLDIPSVARGLGADCLVIEGPGDLLAAAGRFSLLTRPLVIDARITASAKLPPNSRFETVSDNQTSRN